MGVLLLVAAAVCFGIAALNLQVKVNMVALGLLFLTLSFLV